MNQEKIGKFILKLRKAQNMTQEDLANKLNINVKSISRWENGKNLPDHSLIIELCNLFNISTNELYKGIKIKKSQKIRQIIIFYILISFTSIFIIPFLGIISPTLLISAILIFIASLIDLITLIITGNDIPQILFQIGNTTLHPIIAFPISIIIAIFLFFIGLFSWKLMIKYINFISKQKKKLYNEL